jgi:hypothetical protein
MPCCNKRRALLAPGASRSAARGVPGSGGVPGFSDVPGYGATPGRSGVPVRFVGTTRVRVEGTVSGRIYRASPGDRLLTASPEDLRGLLRSGLFVAASPD